MFASLGIVEIMVIVLVVLLLFGAKRIPAIGRGLGEGITNFMHAVRGKADHAHDLPHPSARPEDRSPPP